MQWVERVSVVTINWGKVRVLSISPTNSAMPVNKVTWDLATSLPGLRWGEAREPGAEHSLSVNEQGSMRLSFSSVPPPLLFSAPTSKSRCSFLFSNPPRPENSPKGSMMIQSLAPTLRKLAMGGPTHPSQPHLKIEKHICAPSHSLHCLYTLPTIAIAPMSHTLNTTFYTVAQVSRWTHSMPRDSSSSFNTISLSSFPEKVAHTGLRPSHHTSPSSTLHTLLPKHHGQQRWLLLSSSYFL